MSITLTAKQHKSLITKSKVGWACFFKAEQLNHELHMEQMETLKKLEEKMKERESKSEIWNIPEFVKTEITDMIKELKKNVECPICYEELTADKIKFSGCGHKYCETCLSKINECAICRRKIYRKD